jgi:hypothetical protein
MGIPLAPGMEMTSLISGPHHGAGHREGRAADFALPHTAQAWAFIASAIRSGRFSAIGTTAQAAENPDMQALAQQYGVDLFVDEGTGSHVHLEVAP